MARIRRVPEQRHHLCHVAHVGGARGRLPGPPVPSAEAKVEIVPPEHTLRVQLLRRQVIEETGVVGVVDGFFAFAFAFVFAFASSSSSSCCCCCRCWSSRRGFGVGCGVDVRKGGLGLFQPLVRRFAICWGTSKGASERVSE